MPRLLLVLLCAASGSAAEPSQKLTVTEATAETRALLFDACWNSLAHPAVVKVVK